MISHRKAKWLATLEPLWAELAKQAAEEGKDTNE